MTESSQAESPEFKTPIPQRDMTPVPVPDAPAPPPERLVDGPRDLTPISWGGVYDTDADFRPQPTLASVPAPKDLSAAGSADFSTTQADLIPTLEETTPSQPEGLATSAVAAKVSTPTLPPVPSKPTS